jgi:hypothetical protein
MGYKSFNYGNFKRHNMWKKVTPRNTDILCDCCKIPLKDFEVFLTIADKIKLCSSCKLKTLKNEP